MVTPARRRIGFMVPSIFLKRAFSRTDYDRFIATAEQGRASSLLVGDHMNYYSSTFECFTLLSYVTAKTRLRVGTNVIVLPLRQPYIVAKMAATIGRLATAGFFLGVGVGGEHPGEFAAVGVPLAERGARMDEGLALIKALRDGGQVDLDGRFFHAAAARLDPLGSFPLLVGGRSDRALERVARFGDGWTSAWVKAEHFSKGRSRVEELAAANGRSPTEFEWLAHVRVTLGENESTAWATAAEYLGAYYGADPTPFRAHSIVGPPRRAADAIARYYEAGAEEVIVTFAADDLLGQLEQFTADVVPILDLV
jgi:alkanesulfonate monooxygenase SsuD/methylene tetrahydromethanopterin reductase-like flavin-dependent oxidoreductase (luciferase family)